MRFGSDDRTNDRCNCVPGRSSCENKINAGACPAVKSCIGHTHNTAALINNADAWRVRKKIADDRVVAAEIARFTVAPVQGQSSQNPCHWSDPGAVFVQ